MTDAPTPSAAKTEPVAWVLMRNDFPHSVFTDKAEVLAQVAKRKQAEAEAAKEFGLTSVHWSAYDVPLRTHPHPSLSVGLDREAAATIKAALNSKAGTVDLRDFTAELTAILALAAPAEGYVLVPVEAVQPFLDAMKVIRPDDHDTSKICLATVADYRRLAACLPAAPTGETGV